MKEKEVVGHFSTFLENPRPSRLRYWNNIRNVFKPWKNVKNSVQTTLSHAWHSYKNPHAQHTIETTNAQHALKTTLFWKCISINFRNLGPFHIWFIQTTDKSSKNRTDFTIPPEFPSFEVRIETVFFQRSSSFGPKLTFPLFSVKFNFQLRSNSFSNLKSGTTNVISPNHTIKLLFKLKTWQNH